MTDTKIRNRSWPYSLLAGVCDFYFLTFAGGFLAALYSASVGAIVAPSIALLILFVSLVAPTIYHSIIASRLSKLSPGELIAGRTLNGTTKTWSNPYGRNRWALFAVIIVTLVMVGNSWDAVFDGVPWSLQAAISTGTRALLIGVGLVFMATGRMWGALVPIFFYSLGAIVNYQPNDEMATSAAYIFAFVAIANALVAVLYSWLRVPVKPDAGEGGSSSHESYKVGRLTRVLVAAFFFFMSIMFWLILILSGIYSEIPSSNNKIFLFLAFSMSVSFVLSSYWAFKYRSDS